MRKSSEQFRAAILSSLNRLLATGGKFTRAEVVSGALLPNGDPVGRSTLYRKDKFGNFVHAELLRILDDAVAPSSTSKAKPERGDDAERVALRSENASLIDQMVTLERDLQALAAQVRTGRGRERMLEMEKYVLAKILNERDSSIVMCRRTISEFERRFAGKSEMVDAVKILDHWRAGGE